MPHFTLQIGSSGPIVTAYVVVSKARAAALLAASQPVPAPQRILALIDTGASCTCIEPAVVQALGLTPTGSIPIHTPSTAGTPHVAQQYDVGLVIPGAEAADPELFFDTVPVTGTELLDGQGFHALIGRDILSRCFFVYNGTRGFFTLAY